MNTVSDDFKESLLSDNPLFKCPLKLLKAGFCSPTASWMWMPRLTIIMLLIRDRVGLIFGWWCDNLIQTQVAVATRPRCQGNMSAISVLATIKDITMPYSN
jgi:hypothetical protein